MLWAWALEPYPVSPEELGYMREAQSGTKKNQNLGDQGTQNTSCFLSYHSG